MVQLQAALVKAMEAELVLVQSPILDGWIVSEMSNFLETPDFSSLAPQGYSLNSHSRKLEANGSPHFSFQGCINN